MLDDDRKGDPPRRRTVRRIADKPGVRRRSADFSRAGLPRDPPRMIAQAAPGAADHRIPHVSREQGPPLSGGNRASAFAGPVDDIFPSHVPKQTAAREGRGNPRHPQRSGQDIALTVSRPAGRVARRRCTEFDGATEMPSRPATSRIASGPTRNASWAK